MATIDLALPWMLSHEGGLGNHPLDKGGETNFGITQWSLNTLNLEHPGLHLPTSVRDLTTENAYTFYENAGYWFFDHIVSQGVATKLFDMSVNMGPYRAIKLAQSGCNTVGSSLDDDGKWGPKTEVAVNRVDAPTMMRLLCSKSEDHYRAIVEHDPSQKVFLRGWLRRANDIPSGESL